MLLRIIDFSRRNSNLGIIFVMETLWPLNMLYLYRFTVPRGLLHGQLGVHTYLTYLTFCLKANIYAVSWILNGAVTFKRQVFFICKEWLDLLLLLFIYFLLQYFLQFFFKYLCTFMWERLKVNGTCSWVSMYA